MAAPVDGGRFFFRPRRLRRAVQLDEADLAVPRDGTPRKSRSDYRAHEGEEEIEVEVEPRVPVALASRAPCRRKEVALSQGSSRSLSWSGTTTTS